MGNNRIYTNKKQPRGSGGVGFLVHDCITDNYDVDIIDRDSDGIIAISLVHKKSNYSTMVIGMYIPPENSVYGDNVDVFLDNVMNMLYEYNHFDMTIICGDLNSRVGHAKDFIEEIDNIPDRVVIDDTVNPHGNALCDYCIEGKLAIVNGRISPLNDNFTCVSIKGHSVVDYFIVSHENLENVQDFKGNP